MTRTAIDEIYHEGELAVQKRAGEARVARMNGAAISDRIPGGALRFIEQQPMAIVGSLDPEGRVWASVLIGRPGFLKACHAQSLELDVTQPRSATDDPLWENLDHDPRVGLLVIELGSRRRLRVNGRAHRLSDTQYAIDVEQAYPNCPKYIQRRHWARPTDESLHPIKASRHGARVTTEHRGWIQDADTFFVASAHPARGVDASHRGGRPGFVQVTDPSRLRVPDFDGNSMFNTLGNFASYPHAGLVFVDFAQARVLQITGRPEILWDHDDPTAETGGTRRYWDLHVEAWQESELPYRLDWELLDYSPFNPSPQSSGPEDIGSHELRVERIRNEVQDIKSFRLTAPDGRRLSAFEAGAHLPVKVRLPGGEWAERHYSLLSDPSDRDVYEIGVLLEPNGTGGSRFLHESIEQGNVLAVGAPRNAFPMTTDARHSVLIAGGIGITPILAMLRTLSAENRSFELHYSARSKSQLAFRDTIEALAGEHAHFYASRGSDGKRIDLQTLLGDPQPGIHVYVCGPRRMIEAVRDTAARLGWDAEQIRFESFGARPTADDRPVRVHLARSERTFTVPARRSILDTLLDAGISVPHDCKRGECSLCATRVLTGEPEHRDLCLNTDERAQSMCVCVSRSKSDDLTLDL